ncbi:MAG: glycoside hydrolase family 28 protein [Fusobacteriaceae bacterium]
MLRIQNITSRSGSFEIENYKCYFSGKKIDIYLNGKFMREEERNSFSLHNLIPETEYLIELKEKGILLGKDYFRTLRESVRLGVKKFGAAGDGKKDDTLAIQTAIAACPKNGTVYLSEGIYKVNSIFLKSHMTLEIAVGAVLQGSGDIENYSVLPGIVDGKNGEEFNYGSWEGNPLDIYAGVVNGIDVENISIVGEGIIDGGGGTETWWKNPKMKKKLAWRPRTIFLNRCKNITVEGVTIQNSPSWTVHPYFCQGIKFLNLTIENPDNSPNTDGIDPESCRDVTILGVKFSVGDDCIAIKSGKIYMGKKYKIPTENVVIRNSLMKFGHGAVVIGSEMAGGVKNVRISNCVFYHTDRGIRMKTRRGRGEDGIIDEIYAENIEMINVATPFTVNPFYFCDPDGKSEYVATRKILCVDERTPAIKNITYKNIKATGVKIAAGYIAGLPEKPIENLNLENLYIEIDSEEVKAGDVEMFLNCPVVKKRGFILENIKNLNIKNVELKGIEGEEYDIK